MPTGLSQPAQAALRHRQGLRARRPGGYAASRAGDPKAIVERLNAEFVKILAMPDVRQTLANHGVQPGGGTPESLGALLASEIDKWGKVIREAGIRVE